MSQAHAGRRLLLKTVCGIADCCFGDISPLLKRGEEVTKGCREGYGGMVVLLNIAGMSRQCGGQLYIGWCVVFMLLFTKAAFAVIKITPPEGVTQGKPARISLMVKDGMLRSGELYYRLAGSTYFQRAPITVTGPAAGFVDIPAAAVVSPGLEYYVRVAGAGGRVSASPYNAPLSYHRLDVRKPVYRPDFTLLSPHSDVTLHGGHLKVELHVDGLNGELSPENTLLMVDDTDVTALAVFDSGRILLETELLPDDGEHELKLAVLDNAGEQHEQSWNFSVDNKGRRQAENDMYVSGGLSFNYGSQLRSSSSPRSTASANLNVTTGVKGDDWDLRLNGVNLQYVKDSLGDDLTISSGFTITFTKGQQLVEYGDITISETRLTAPSFSRRGIQARLKAFDSEFRLFQVAAEAVTGWESGLADGGQRVYGFSANRNLLAGDRLPVSLTYIQGENRSPAGANSNGVDPPVKGDVLGLKLEHEFNDINVIAEVASSRFDADTTDAADAQRDSAATLAVSTSIHDLSLGADLHYYGTDFASIANPNFTADRAGLNLNAATVMGLSNVSLSLSHNRDNLDNDNSRPVVTSTIGSVNYGIAAEPWPSLNLAYSHSVQSSDEALPGVQAVANTNDVFSVALEKSGRLWGIGFNSNFSTLKDDIGNLDSDTRSASLVFRYHPDNGLAHNLSLTVTESTSSGVLKRTQIASVTSSGAPLVLPYLNTSLQASYSTNEASDNSLDSSNINATLRLSVDINKYVNQWFGSESGTVALSANYSRIRDNITPANSATDISILLSVNIFTPLGGLW